MTTDTQRPQFHTPDRRIRSVDYGFFGPGSPTWKVWTAPTAVIAFQRAVSLEHFDSGLTASVADLGGIYSDPLGRLDHTFAYFLIVAVGDSQMAIEASEHLMAVHAKSTGIDPITGRRYSANNPDSQLWIHVTGWHSVLKCYEVYGPGPLTPEEEARYWEECVIAAELQTCKISDVPRTRTEVREYFERVRPTLCVSERARRGMHYLLFTPYSRGLKIGLFARLSAPAAIATLPRWMRRLGGFELPPGFQTAYRPLVRAAVASIANRPAASAKVARQVLGPMTGKLYHQHVVAGTPTDPSVVTVADARERYGRTGRSGSVEAAATSEAIPFA
ncbi:oxygenase MpaB family protein [Gordonia phthalatica]|uniref:Long-chain fatty acid--CoA ligase n=1 Tax=Gordonia phthalatica TaxID=1136941 RepID=A0A0N9NGX8_9ACTN|nr:oxygenase MpaB family protein [Gordonia phthalatica]ALG87016.1 long-chain fatty acid--CoA ligase [Gordonia phthalatica]